jgi:hypothetical protein
MNCGNAGLQEVTSQTLIPEADTTRIEQSKYTIFSRQIVAVLLRNTEGFGLWLTPTTVVWESYL